MVPPPASRMTASQRSTVEAALNSTFVEGKRFDTFCDLDQYLQDHLATNLLEKFKPEIFDRYTQLRAARDKLPLSPPLSRDGPQSNTPESSLDAEDHSEEDDTGKPIFTSEDDTFPMNIHLPRGGQFGLLISRYCKGRISYISEEAARRCYLVSRNNKTILTWNYLGKGHELAYTTCEIIDKEHFSQHRCEVALAEEHGTKDREEIEEEEAEGQTMDLGLANPMTARSFGAPDPLEFSPEELLELRMAAVMNSASANIMVKRKASLLPSSEQYGSTSCSIETTRKKSRLS
ncbi:hypothetical protein DL95DRAFT_91041 [Leptodontidium sp. 2 PMI_412]|nr:hypothetical protein DL95DRAFT_91041 [Leptodontidium sp. 2 PMI_412]